MVGKFNAGFIENCQAKLVQTNSSSGRNSSLAWMMYQQGGERGGKTSS